MEQNSDDRDYESQRYQQMNHRESISLFEYHRVHTELAAQMLGCCKHSNFVLFNESVQFIISSILSFCVEQVKSVNLERAMKLSHAESNFSSGKISLK
jgi:hypothetical protein